MKRDVRDENKGESRDEGAPDGEEVDADEGVRAFADPANSGVSARSAADTEHSDQDGTEALGGGDLVEAVRVGWGCGSDVD